MHNMKRRGFSFLLALVLMLVMIPMAASAVEMKDYNDVSYVQQSGSGKFVSTYKFDNGIVIVDVNGKVAYSNQAGYKAGDVINKVTGAAGTMYGAHVHSYDWTVNRDGHFYGCSCGAKRNFQAHISPADAVDGRCTCGYKFMDNADLTVLWMYGIKLSPSLKKGVYDYEGKLLVKDLEETKVSAFSFDAKATVELPKDLTLKEGTNTFQFKVTAEDGVTTNTYTVTVEK